MPRGPNKNRWYKKHSKHLLSWESSSVRRYLFLEDSVKQHLTDALVHRLCSLAGLPCNLVDPTAKEYVDSHSWASTYIRDDRAPGELVRRGWAKVGRTNNHYGRVRDGQQRNTFKLTDAGLEAAKYASEHSKLPPAPVTPRSERRERQPYTRF